MHGRLDMAQCPQHCLANHLLGCLALRWKHGCSADLARHGARQVIQANRLVNVTLVAHSLAGVWAQVRSRSLPCLRAHSLLRKSRHVHGVASSFWPEC